MTLEDLERVHMETRAHWRAWLRRNHRRATGVWLVTWRKASGRPVLAYDDIVEEALCFGWIDSKGGSVDADRTRLLLTPRKKGSGWSRPNKMRIEALEATGAMAAPGRAVIEAARADGSWTRLDDVEKLVVPKDLAAAFRTHAGSKQQWDGFPRSVRMAILEWISNAKRPETRAKRIEETARLAAEGERANQWRPRS
ncbi:MAG: YdeI/OmpD-associated family protein [Acidimicrobiia bacterium]|nr:YdeI/OmpD-associated family protein [Acidimicrobiia bacterium]